MRRVSILLALGLFLAAPLSADTAKPPATAPDLSPENLARLASAIEHYYRLEFAEGLEVFDQVIAAEPHSASARAFLASALLFQILAAQGTLQSTLFVTDNQFLKIERPRPHPSLVQQLHEHLREAEKLARSRLEKDPQDADGLFARALVHAVRANFDAAVEAEYVRGLKHGEKAYESSQKLAELYPEIHDSRVFLGVHNYIIGSLPAYKRFFLFFVGIKGDRQRGLDQLQEAAQEGEFLRTYSRILLAVAYMREQRWAEARRELEGLREDYPENVVFLLELARFYRERGQPERALGLYQETLAVLAARSTLPIVLSREQILLDLGRAQAAAGQLPAAVDTFERVLGAAEANKILQAWALLEMGRVLDQQGERADALRQYEKVLKLQANEETVRLARAHQQEPYSETHGP